jgi:hypothetical protein
MEHSQARTLHNFQQTLPAFCTGHSTTHNSKHLDTPELPTKGNNASNLLSCAQDHCDAWQMQNTHDGASGN